MPCTHTLLLAALSALLLSPALAEPTQDQRNAVARSWSEAEADWAPVFTCGATISKSDAYLRSLWVKEQDKALAAMELAGWSATELAYLRQTTSADALRLPGSTPFSNLIAYCTRQKNWIHKANRLDLKILSSEVEQILGMYSLP